MTNRWFWTSLLLFRPRPLHLLKYHSNNLRLYFMKCIFYSESWPIFPKNRSSRPELFCKNVVLRNFAKFTGKYLCKGLFRPFFTEHLRALASGCGPVAKWFCRGLCNSSWPWVLVNVLYHVVVHLEINKQT